MIVELLFSALWEIVSCSWSTSSSSAASVKHFDGGPAHPCVAGVPDARRSVGRADAHDLAGTRFQPGAVRGASLLLSPLMTGAIMDRYGGIIEARGGTRSITLRRSGVKHFAFGMALRGDSSGLEATSAVPDDDRILLLVSRNIACYHRINAHNMND